MSHWPGSRLGPPPGLSPSGPGPIGPGPTGPGPTVPGPTGPGPTRAIYIQNKMSFTRININYYTPLVSNAILYVFIYIYIIYIGLAIALLELPLLSGTDRREKASDLAAAYLNQLRSRSGGPCRETLLGAAASGEPIENSNSVGSRQ